MSYRPLAHVAATMAFAMGTVAAAATAPDDFLNAIGGSSDVKTVGAGTPQAMPFTRDRQWLVGARFFSEKLKSGAMSTAEAARTAFEQQCRGQGGQIVPDSHPSSISFRRRFLDDLVRPTGYRHQWRGLAIICAADQNHIAGAMMAVVFDPTAVATSGDAGSRMMAGLFTQPTKTAIYVFRPDAVLPLVAAEQQTRQDVEARLAARQASLKAAEEFQKTLQVGLVTSCGMIIEMRGAVAQVQQNGTYIGVTAPTRWIRVDQLAPRGAACLQ
jgi:hypothetical protein